MKKKNETFTVLRMMHTNMSSKCHRPFYHRLWLCVCVCVHAAAASVREFDVSPDMQS